MRELRRNKQTLYYALYKGSEPIYRVDEDGNRVVVYMDNSTDPPTEYYDEIGREDVYENPVKFKGNIALTSGDSQVSDFGVNIADYEAVLLMPKNSTPITETTLIWQNNEPTVDANGHPDISTADFRVIKKKPSLNEDRFVLAKVVQNGEV